MSDSTDRTVLFNTVVEEIEFLTNCIVQCLQDSLGRDLISLMQRRIQELAAIVEKTQ
jgi:hypothetical protein